jgi:hypothetical protein
MATTTAKDERNLYERLQAITDEIAVKATGKNPFDRSPAISIEDVETPLRALLVKHGVHIRFSKGAVELVEAKTWRASVEAVVRDVASGDAFSDSWQDTGGNPAAAYSFARKSYLKALFHIAEAEDETSAPPQTNVPPARVSSSAPRSNGAKPKVHVEWTPVGRGCPECGSGNLRVGTMSDGRAFVGCDQYPTCRYTEKVERVEPEPVAVGGDVDPDEIPF